MGTPFVVKSRHQIHIHIDSVVPAKVLLAAGLVIALQQILDRALPIADGHPIACGGIAHILHPYIGGYAHISGGGAAS